MAEIRRCLHADEDRPGVLTADSRAALRLRLAWPRARPAGPHRRRRRLEAFDRLTPPQARGPGPGPVHRR
ncbi:MAG: hypothetical protein R3F30_03485 [Planctomycetota bacterium]